ncbi:tRNA (guanosine(37)-N1)-methyltransferase TrmD [Paraglaciecola chathamensis]|jgi:tRNA (guanine37-N1)-methyltransferase|uniref:tRNA (guanine-N(1)-)-methyltransferase n=3 Tax=Paraglaciecola chathamensis TaxID=368405 RepID=A0A8H9M3D1_9ALTE|nr:MULTISPECIES: tRNA (guanosine(37)-N1)-methyltransferase TrmD [Paraglaciecola]AEE23689.1 tRNA (guanine-N1)-methyltransferase [Glaciecola sp. 4H-3-7+YE-5]MBN27306.1 tRNA (guanosine(37)-N1)-methyltransferase TrmD [Alteromonadaceae bacterium]MBJ2138650.1 tRNA (guanosine(37)-N1)-methyltransferase TrmD [Paraglaciecola chathamensis]MBU3016366.1 tRNA (guanosine(37)-N1)-methyltransferase TrmD [Paraglaciecola agarilytica]MDO6560000.1 tRNA (guanosine(37)-N1)-methyltransferase TrmD [Paraglaciecola chat|tara:strand:- start:3804 stop:4601 length:798 start_codon:yes stop_codon:yes gene_type:complete
MSSDTQRWFGVVSLFPEMFQTFTEQGVTGRAVKSGKLKVDFFNPRDFTHDKHRTVDDRPYGGGPGMLMMVQPLLDAIRAAKQAAEKKTKVIYLSPQGKTLTQRGVKQLSENESVILVAGRYEGIDERVIEAEIDEEWSVGDYILSGGELPAMILMDAVARLVPGVLGHAQSAEQDSFSDGLLDCPHYTRPENLNGQSVPSVLLSGDHQKIKQWREKQSLGRTWQRRPELLNDLALTEEQQRLLDEYQQELLQQNGSYSGMRGYDE